MKYFGVATLIISTAMLYNCSKAPNDRLEDARIVLQVGDNKLTLGDLNNQTRAAVFTDVNHEYEAKKAYLEQYLERFLLIEGAKEAGLTAELDSSAIKRNLLRQYYYKEVTRDLKVSDTEIRAFAQKYGGKIQPGHLLVRSKELADSLYQALAAGADFEMLVKQFSKDASTADMGGSLGYVEYSGSDDEFEEAVFALKIGEISRPVQTRFGWHIIKLYDRQDVSAEEIEKNISRFNGLARSHAELAAMKRLKEKVKSKYHFEVIWPTLEFLAQKADSVKALGIKPGDLLSSAYLDISLFTKAEMEAYAVKYDGGGLKVGELLSRLMGFVPERAPELRAKAVMEDFFEESMLPVLVERMALEEGFDKSEQFLAELERLRGNALMQKMRDRVYGSVREVTEEDIAKYYNEHPEEFYFPDQIRASVITIKTRQEADEILQRIKNGAIFQQMARKYSVDKRIGAGGGDLNFFTVKRYTPIYMAAESLRIGDVGGPVEFEGNWWIFKLTDRITRQPKRLDLVRADLKSRLFQEWRQKAYDEFISRMKEKIPCKMDLEFVKNNLRMGKYQEAGEPKG